MADKVIYDDVMAKLGGHKRYLSKLANNTANYVDKGKLEGETLIGATELADTLSDRLVLVQSIFDDLLGNSNLSEDDIDTFETYITSIRNKLTKLKFSIADSKKVLVEEKKPPADFSSPLEKNSTGVFDSAIKYPEIKLPQFSGGVNGVKDFRPFYQIFKVLVEDKEGIPEIYKVQYLRECLPVGSEARQLIEYIPPTAENYSLHMGTLMSRYYDDVGEVNRLRRVLKQVSSWQVCNSVESQRKLVAHVTQNLSLLEQLEDVDVADMKGLALDVLAVLPERLKFKVAKLPKEKRDVGTILKLVEESISRKLEVNSFAEPKKPAPKPQSFLYHSSKHSASYSQSRSSGQSQSKSSSQAQVLPCVYCGDVGHSPHHCTKKSKDDRAAVVLKGRRCWNCLSDQHQVKSCPLPSRCQCDHHKQKDKHSQSLCGLVPPWRFRGTRPGGAYVIGDPVITGQGTGTGLNTDIHTGLDIGATYLSTVEVDLPAKGGGQLKVRFLLDQCATHSYGKETTIDRLKVVDGPAVDIAVSTFSGIRQISARMVQLVLPGGIGNINVIVTDSICEPMGGHNVDESCSKELEGYQLSDPSCLKEGCLPIDILLGVDNYWKMVTDEIVRLRSGLVLISTKFGWALSGTAPSRRSLIHEGTYLAHTLHCGESWRDSTVYGLASQDTWCDSHALCSSEKSGDIDYSVEFMGPHSHVDVVDGATDSDLEEVKCGLERFWDLDTLGIKLDREISPVLEDFQHTLSQDPESGRYTVSLPRKQNIVHLPSNFSSSRLRLNSLMMKLQRPGNEDYARKYVGIIEDQLKQGIIEKVSLSESEMKSLQEDGSSCCGEFYIPHHGVLKEGKVRVVMDGSASAYKGALSLNQCLLVGPSLNNLLAEVLLTFRLHPVVLVADIMKAFLQVGVAEADRDLLRFLWYDDGGKLEVYRFTRVPFGTGPSPFLLNATLKHHFEKVVKDQTLLFLLLRSLYVDDLLTGGETAAAVLQLRVEVEKILGQAAMELHGWDSNSAEVRASMGVESESDEKVLLGVCWNRKRDDMGLNLKKILGHSKGAASKRELLRGTSKFFDPHGLFCPVVLLPKLMFQKVCSSRYGWDDPLPEGIAKDWSEWQEQLVLLEEVRVQRNVLLPNYDRLELHGFSDASQLAYSAVIYIKSSRGDDSSTHLIMCKNRVAPQKKLTIPRLELMGALLLARLMAVVAAFLKHLKIDAIVYYSDSMNVLYWLRSEHRMWAVFVACRIKEINALSSFTSWKYVPTDQNPADIATRGLKPSELKESQLWWHGPEFLRTGRVDPEIDASSPTTECLQEKKKVVQVVVQVQSGVGTVLKCEDFSSLNKLLSRTVLYLRFVYWVAKKFSKDPGERFDFSIQELYGQARRLWVKFVQAEYYSVEIGFCKNNPATRPSGMRVPSSLLKQLDLRLDQQGILRVGTRLQNAVIPDSVKYPVLLPKESHLSKLLITETHLRLCHAGVRQVLSSVRGLYWIPQARRTIAKIVRACVNCRKVTAGCYPTPDPPPLPDFRVAKVSAFDHIGVDHCGPFYVKEGRGKPQKAYVLIFTCAVSRGVHLELVRNMSVEYFMIGFRNFVSRRGLPEFILSDNSQTFKCASKELTAILNDPQCQKYLNRRNIRWQRYLEYSPWWGGWIENLNGVFKSAIHKVLGGSTVSFTELSTLLFECEAIMNSRPISYVYDDVNEGQAITPSILICGKDLTQLPPNMFDFKFGRKKPLTCKERLKYLEKLKTYFWTRWSREYLTELSARHAATRKGVPVREPKVGDVVLVKEGGETVKIPRHKWPLGKIVTLYEGRDGKVRSVDVKLAQPKYGKPNVLRHKSPRHLVPLECEESDQ